MDQAVLCHIHAVIIEVSWRICRLPLRVPLPEVVHNLSIKPLQFIVNVQHRCWRYTSDRVLYLFMEVDKAFNLCDA